LKTVGDSSGDSRLFVEGLARRCQESLGVTVKLGARVTGLRAEGDWIDGVLTSQGTLAADNYVLAQCTVVQCREPAGKSNRIRGTVQRVAI